MRILIEGRNLENYLARCHEAFRTGLRAMFDARCYGRGYPGYRPRFLVPSYRRILERTFPEGGVDLAIVDASLNQMRPRVNYDGLADIDATAAFVLGDYWDFTDEKLDLLSAFVEANRIGMILSYFPQPLALWSRSGIAGKLRYLPPCFDPRIFNDWGEAKTWDVGFLAAGTTEPMPTVYPERWKIHQTLLRHTGIRYLWAQHPGWKERSAAHPLVGRNFSKAINSCRIFITTGGVLRNAHAKIIEALASRVVLMCDDIEGAAGIGLVDGENYVRITATDVVDRIDHLLQRPDICERIADAGYRLAMQRHTCYARALDLAAAVAADPQRKPTP